MLCVLAVFSASCCLTAAALLKHCSQWKTFSDCNFKTTYNVYDWLTVNDK